MKLYLYYPVKPFKVIQPFGVNGDYYRANGINILGHDGIDLEASHGQPVYAAHDGQAYFEIDEKGGHGVVIRSNNTFDYGGTQVYMKSIYWHLCDGTKEPQFDSPVKITNIVGNGQPIKTGDLVGYADSTGLSTGDHLHFSIKPMDMTGEYPGQFANYEQNNGYLGNIDPTPYLNGLYAQDIGSIPPITSPIDSNSVKHTFYTPIKYGNVGSEVLALQRCLQSIGLFPAQVQATGNYGNMTRQAVFDFDKQYAITGVVSFIAVWGDRGNHVGPVTIPALNKIFA